ncbi:MAG TPA: hypothetical protein VNA69_20555 [Thermoanaerobaculia bacterium]|nr:hypothetical protein [Thermoanaerobaculia bacterium]
MSAHHEPDETAAKFLEIVRAKHPLRDDVRELLIEFGQELSTECIQPYEILQAESYANLSAERREHAATCERCRLVVAAPPSEYVEAAVREARYYTVSSFAPMSGLPAGASAARAGSSYKRWWLIGPVLAAFAALSTYLVLRFRKTITTG